MYVDSLDDYLHTKIWEEDRTLYLSHIPEYRGVLPEEIVARLSRINQGVERVKDRTKFNLVHGILVGRISVVVGLENLEYDPDKNGDNGLLVIL